MSGSLVDRLHQQRLGPADDVVNDAQLLGRPRYLKTGQKDDPISDWKAWPRRNGVRFRLRPASPTGRPQPLLATPAHLRTASPTRRPGQNTTFDSNPLLRPGMRRTPAYSSSPTGAIKADWDKPTGDARSVRTRKQTKKVRQRTQVKRNTRNRTLCTC